MWDSANVNLGNLRAHAISMSSTTLHIHREDSRQRVAYLIFGGLNSAGPVVLALEVSASNVVMTEICRPGSTPWNATYNPESQTITVTTNSVPWSNWTVLAYDPFSLSC